MEPQQHAVGTLVGLACGDALGRPVEFKSPAEIETMYGTLTEMEANGTWGQPAGTTTDDTAMLLCIARSLVESHAFTPEDIVDRFVEWKRSGPFDIGNMTRDALDECARGRPWDEAGEAVWNRRSEGQNAGNGSVMRCAPYGVAYCDDRDQLETVSRHSSQITHYDPRCQWGCAVLNLVLADLITDGSEMPVQTALERVEAQAPGELLDALRPLTAGRTSLSSDDLQSTGYVIHTLQAGLYHGLYANSAEEAIINAVNMGGDADTVGAVTGAVAGARFGVNALPERWLQHVDHRDELGTLAADLLTAEMD